MKAISKYIRMSPFKLRPYADVIRGHSVESALAWLKTCAVQRAKPIEKVIYSAFSNAKQATPEATPKDFTIKKICIDGGPLFTYFTPAAMGRAVPQKKRLSHIRIELERLQ